MFGIWNKFYDEFWNFNNDKFIKLLEKARNSKKKWDKKWTWFKNKEIILFSSVSKKDMWKFINKLSIFINSWVDIKWALNIIFKQIKHPALKKIVIEIRDNIDYGIGMSETMNRHPKVFDPLTISLIWVWEKTWLLWQILNELDTNLLESIELKWRIKSAMVYPAVLLLLVAAMLTFMMIFIIPKITDTFTQVWAELPALTSFIVDVSNFIRYEWYKLLLIIFWIYATFKMINMTYAWKYTFAKLYTKLPIFWYIVKQSNIVYFIQSFTILLSSGVLLLESIKVASRVVPNLAYKKEVIRIKNEIEFWLTISKSLWLNMDYKHSIYLNEYFPEDFAYVVNVWEETGSLSESLEKVWKNYNSELKRYIWNLSTMMEPLIIVIVGALVGTIVIAIMLPFFKMWDVVWMM